jgi:hypothetical protein
MGATANDADVLLVLLFLLLGLLLGLVAAAVGAVTTTVAAPEDAFLLPVAMSLVISLPCQGSRWRTRGG